ncbi:MAG TPA: hypothetical protein VLV83_04565 [Acidobacteriota bacterium]|nr:hypothetical protein [Acidobacteriota bacterium]
MLAVLLSLTIIVVALALASVFHLSGMATRLEEGPAVDSSLVLGIEEILKELENPAHVRLAAESPAYARDVLLFAFDALERDLKILMRVGAPSLLPQFLAFRFYLTVFRVKTRLRADLGDLQYLIGYEFYLLQRLSSAA